MGGEQEAAGPVREPSSLLLHTAPARHAETRVQKVMVLNTERKHKVNGTFLKQEKIPKTSCAHSSSPHLCCASTWTASNVSLLVSRVA